MKKKLCDGCNTLQFIWRSSGTGGKRYCKSCWSAHNARPIPRASKKKIPPRSPKRIIQDTMYSVLRKVFLEEYPICEAHIQGVCTQHSTDVHHKAGREGDLYLDVFYWLSACRACHSYIEEHPREAYIRELSIRSADVDTIMGTAKGICDMSRYKTRRRVLYSFKEGQITAKEVIKLTKLLKSKDEENVVVVNNILDAKIKK